MAETAQRGEELLPRLSLLVAMNQHEHLSAAAAAAGIAQSTASRWVATLSETVEVSLATHDGPRVVLTASGTILADAVADAQSVLDGGLSKAREANDPRRGHITLGFLRSTGASTSPQLVSGYRRTRPEVAFTLVQGPHEDLVGKLHEGTLDVALSTIRQEDRDLMTAPLVTERFVVVASTGHRLGRRRHVRLTDLRDVGMVGLSPGIALRDQVDALFRSGGLRPRYGFLTDEVATVRGLAAAGTGVAVLPAREGGPLPGSVELPLSPPRVRKIGLLASTHRQMTPVTASFWRWATHNVTGGHQR